MKAMMRQMTLTSLMTVLILFAALNVQAADGDILIWIDGDSVTFTENSGAPYIDGNDRTMVPFRQVLETFGAVVDWENETRTAIAVYDHHEVRVPIGSKVIYSGSDRMIIDTEAVIVNGRTYLPIRAVAESFGARVSWDEVNRGVVIERDALETPTYEMGELLALGMSLDTIAAQLGEVDIIVPSIYDFEWYIYNDDYGNYRQLGIKDGQLRAIYATNTMADWVYAVEPGMTSDDVQALENEGTIAPSNSGWLNQGMASYLVQEDWADYYIYPYYDRAQGMTVDTVMIVDADYRFPETAVSDEVLADGFEKQIFELTNVFRHKFDKQPFVYDADVSDVARNHSLDMAVNGYFDHVSLDGLSPGDRLEEANLSYRSFGENIAAGYYSAIGAMDGWINSPGHRSGMLSNNEALGVGVIVGQGPYDYYYTQNFYTD